MSRQQSEGEVHVEAMRLILAAMERREDPPDWTIWQHMLNMLETIFQGIEDQRSDDQDELFHTRQERDLAQVETETFRVNADSLRKERDHWKQARQDAHEAGELMRAEIDTLREQLQAEINTLWAGMAADAKRLRDAEERVWPGLSYGCNAPEKMADEILYLQRQLDAAQREASEEFIERQVLTAEQQEGEAAWRQQLDAAHAELERLRAFVNLVREMTQNWHYFAEVDRLRAALAKLDAGTIQPTPCPEIETLRQQLDAAQAEVVKLRTLNDALLEKDKRLRAFVKVMRGLLTEEYADQRIIAEALAELDAGTSEPAPATERQWFRSQVEIKGYVGRVTNDGAEHRENCTVWVSGQSADWRQCIGRTDGQVPDWVWKSMSIHMLYHAETRLNPQTNMLEFRNWELRPEPAPVAEPLNAEGGA